jgi:hypothetical protein
LQLRVTLHRLSISLFYCGTKPTGLLVIGWHAQSEAGNRTVWDVPMAKGATRVPIIFLLIYRFFSPLGTDLARHFAPAPQNSSRQQRSIQNHAGGVPRETLPQISEKIARKQRFMDTAANPA